jgi:hypothetical protein
MDHKSTRPGAARIVHRSPRRPVGRAVLPCEGHGDRLAILGHPEASAVTPSRKLDSRPRACPILCPRARRRLSRREWGGAQEWSRHAGGQNCRRNRAPRDRLWDRAPGPAGDPASATRSHGGRDSAPGADLAQANAPPGLGQTRWILSENPTASTNHTRISRMRTTIEGFTQRILDQYRQGEWHPFQWGSAWRFL